MKNTILCVAMALVVWAVAPSVRAQQQEPQRIPIVSEAMTVGAAAAGFGATTISRLQLAIQASASYNVVCLGTLETAPARYTTEGTTPTAAVGHPWAIDQQIRIDGFATVRGFSIIRTTGVSGAIFWTCYI